MYMYMYIIFKNAYALIRDSKSKSGYHNSENKSVLCNEDDYFVP
jgi:hypothetical protein